MKKTNLFFTLVLFNISFACSQIENYPQIEDFDENSFSIEKVIDGIELSLIHLRGMNKMKLLILLKF